MMILFGWFWIWLSIGSVTQVQQNNIPVLRQYQAPRQVTVRVLSILHPTWIDVTAEPGRWLQLQVVLEDGRSTRVSLERVRLRCGGLAPIELLAKDADTRHAASVVVQDVGGLLTVQTHNQMSRVFSGQLRIREHAGECHIINQTSLEEYVNSVTCREIRGGGIQAHLAQAVLVRTWYLTNRRKHAASGFEVCDLTHCQVYTGHHACRQTMRSTLSQVAGLVLVHKGKLADVAYFSTCGGQTAQAEDIWGPGSKRVYLPSVNDSDGTFDLCAQSPHWRWRFEIERLDFCNQIRKVVPAIGPGVCEVVTHSGQGGWNREVIIVAEGRKRIRGETFHRLMGRVFGWSRFKSANFRLRSHQDRLVFVGKGLGHGVGMCQVGAMGLEKRGATYQEILSHYFPHTQIGRVP